MDEDKNLIVDRLKKCEDDISIIKNVIHMQSLLLIDLSQGFDECIDIINEDCKDG